MKVKKALAVDKATGRIIPLADSTDLKETELFFVYEDTPKGREIAQMQSLRILTATMKYIEDDIKQSMGKLIEVLDEVTDEGK